MAFIVFLALVAAASASFEHTIPAIRTTNVGYTPPIVRAAIPEPSPAHYDFGYDVADPLTGDFKNHHESRRGDAVLGSYSLIDADGSKRTVDYSADGLHGFNAVVHQEAPIVPLPAPLPAPVAVAPLPVPVAPVARYAPVAPEIHEEVRITPVFQQEVVGHTPIAVNHQEFGVAHRPDTFIQPAPVPIPVVHEEYHVAPLPVARVAKVAAPIPIAHEEFRFAPLPIAHEEVRVAPAPFPVAHEEFVAPAPFPVAHEEFLAPAPFPVAHEEFIHPAPLPIAQEEFLPVAHEEVALGRLAVPFGHRERLISSARFGGRIAGGYFGLNHGFARSALPYAYANRY